MPPRRRKRLDPALFELPVEKIKQGCFTDRYFQRTREVLKSDNRDPVVLLQVSAWSAGYVSGIDESVALLKLCSDDWSSLTVHALYEGDRVEPWDTVMTVEGPYARFAHLETLYLGTLTRRTRICTNTRLAVEAARPKPVMFFGARHDHWSAQAGDGFAAFVGGAHAVSTETQGAFFGARAVGIVPHALISAYDGDAVLATKKFADHVGAEIQVIADVDYANDSVGTTLAVARALEGRLWGVRLDTSETLVDKSIVPAMGTFKPTGVNPQLVWNVRNALDAEGLGEVKVIVGGGFDPARIRAFEDEKAPVDFYAVGASIVNDGRFSFSGDIVTVDGRPQSKVGVEVKQNPKLERVK